MGTFVSIIHEHTFAYQHFEIINCFSFWLCEHVAADHTNAVDNQSGATLSRSNIYCCLSFELIVECLKQPLRHVVQGVYNGLILKRLKCYLLTRVFFFIHINVTAAGEYPFVLSDRFSIIFMHHILDPLYICKNFITIYSHATVNSSCRVIIGILGVKYSEDSIHDCKQLN